METVWDLDKEEDKKNLYNNLIDNLCKARDRGQWAIADAWWRFFEAKIKCGEENGYTELFRKEPPEYYQNIIKNKNLEGKESQREKNNIFKVLFNRKISKSDSDDTPLPLVASGQFLGRDTDKTLHDKFFLTSIRSNEKCPFDSNNDKDLCVRKELTNFNAENKEYIKKLLNWICKYILIISGDDFVDKLVEDGIRKIYSIGQNVIIYGAPGTGKSHWVNNYENETEKMSCLTIDKEHITRVVFHPEYTYFDFVGSYRPKSKQEEGSEDKEIEYGFVPGPFTKVLADAWIDTPHIHTLLIEELNRADAAAVFGDMFQLLDRDKKGQSRYSITPSEELGEWLFDKFNDNDKDEDLGRRLRSSLQIPGNMNIIATMNSADQGVHLLDTAFKRRWRYKYISIDKAIKKIEKIKSENDSKAENEIKSMEAYKEQVRFNTEKLAWIKFVQGINKALKENNIPEDRQIGPYFATPEEIEDDNGSAAIEKVLFYLWDDVFRNTEDRSEFFANGITTLGNLIDEKNYQETKVIKADIKND